MISVLCLSSKVRWDLILVMGLAVIGGARVNFEDNMASPCEKTISDEDFAGSSSKRKFLFRLRKGACFSSRVVHLIQILCNH